MIEQYELTGNTGSMYHYKMQVGDNKVTGAVRATGKKHAEEQVNRLYVGWLSRRKKR